MLSDTSAVIRFGLACSLEIVLEGSYTECFRVSSTKKRRHRKYFVVNPVFFKENARYLVWTCRDPIFFVSRDPILNSREQGPESGP